jgi:hypothetical protein
MLLNVDLNQPPRLAYIDIPQAMVSKEFSAVPTLVENGSPLIGCYIKEETLQLPNWATINPANCVITGIPDAPSARTEYTVIAETLAGMSDDVAVSIEVLPEFRLNANSITVTAAAGQSFTFEASGGSGGPFTYAVIEGDGIIEPITGVFEAGSSPGVVLVEATDVTGNTAIATINQLDLKVAGHVYDIATSSDGSAYYGGIFNGVLPLHAPNALEISTDNGAPDLAFDLKSGFDGIVLEILRDEANGVTYFGGNFTKYQGHDVACLAKVDANGNLDSTFHTENNFTSNCGISALQLDYSGQYIYVGGWFDQYRGIEGASNIAKISTTTGEVDEEFHPNSSSGGFDNGVNSMQLSPDGQALYVGGFFTAYRGVLNSAHGIAKLNTNDGTLDTSFHPNSVTGGFTGGDNSPYVNSLQLSADGANLYVGGNFYHYRGVTNSARHIAKLNALTGELDSTFHPPGSGGFNSPNYGDTKVKVIRLDNNNNFLYVGGNFTSYRGASAARKLAKISSTNGALDTTFNPSVANPGFDQQVESIDLDSSGSNVFVAGRFQIYRNVSGYANGIAKLNTSTGDPDASFHPFEIGGFPLNNYPQVVRVTADDSSLIVGGEFRTYHPQVRANNIAKFKEDGTFDTSFSGGQSGFNSYVRALQLDDSGGKLYVGGAFTSYRGVANSSRAIAKLDTSDGSLDTLFHPVSATGGFAEPAGQGRVDTLALSSDKSTIFAGGFFHSYRGVTNSARFVAKLSTSNGDIDTTFHPVSGTGGFNSRVGKIRLSHDGASLFAIGSFTSYRGVANSARYIAKLDTTNGALNTTFYPPGSGGFALNFGGLFPNIEITSDDTTLFVGGDFFGGYRGNTDNVGLFKISAIDGSLITSFSVQAHTPRALLLSRDEQSLFVSGLGWFLTPDMGGEPAEVDHLAKIDTLTGALDQNFKPQIVNITPSIYPVNVLKHGFIPTALKLGGSVSACADDVPGAGTCVLDSSSGEVLEE